MYKLASSENDFGKVILRKCNAAGLRGKNRILVGFVQRDLPVIMI